MTLSALSSGINLVGLFCILFGGFITLGTLWPTDEFLAFAMRQQYILRAIATNLPFFGMSGRVGFPMPLFGNTEERIHWYDVPLFLLINLPTLFLTWQMLDSFERRADQVSSYSAGSSNEGLIVLISTHFFALVLTLTFLWLALSQTSSGLAKVGRWVIFGSSSTEDLGNSKEQRARRVTFIGFGVMAVGTGLCAAAYLYDKYGNPHTMFPLHPSA